MLTSYQRAPGAPWVAFPRTTRHAAQRFIMLGVYSALRFVEADGTIRVEQRT